MDQHRFEKTFRDIVARINRMGAQPRNQGPQPLPAAQRPSGAASDQPQRRARRDR